MLTTDTESRGHSFPIARIDLEEEIRHMRRNHHGGHVGKTLLRSRDQRLVLMTLGAGAALPQHHADGALSLQVVEGRVVVTALDSKFELVAGQLLAIECGVPHSVLALDDSAILQTIAWRG